MQESYSAIERGNTPTPASGVGSGAHGQSLTRAAQPRAAVETSFPERASQVESPAEPAPEQTVREGGFHPRDPIASGIRYDNAVAARSIELSGHYLGHLHRVVALGDRAIDGRLECLPHRTIVGDSRRAMLR